MKFTPTGWAEGEVKPGDVVSLPECVASAGNEAAVPEPTDAGGEPPSPPAAARSVERCIGCGFEGHNYWSCPFRTVD